MPMRIQDETGETRFRSEADKRTNLCCTNAPAIHHVVFACQSMIGGWPTTKYPHTQSAEPDDPVNDGCFGHSLSPGIKISVGGLFGSKTGIVLSICEVLPAIASEMIAFVAETESSASCR